MKTMLPTEVRNRWKKVLSDVAEEAEEVRIHLKDGRGVILMPEEAYEGLIATLEILSDPEAMRSIRRHRSGRAGKTYSLADIDRLIDERP